ncbi:cytosolic phospholipase A2 gamma isoform X2 [Oryzias latipes]|uniref:cytosolic phospholipase A2 gamma isoform X2 n=1 Tax=Oryzias latipes TaxID=8090 RepID=UPI0005CC1B19|nr:cytosolic phospholipase A2 gamma isoform X2 [Oryzias latipes]XP_020557334.1 cytosolic phospholipase A2 gamma isoform X2 [Oryzias latipes]
MAKLVRGGASLCAGEQDYVHKRKQLVLEALHRLEIDCSEDSVPHIALLPSGGGQRAAVALLGSLHQMEKEALLGTLLYLGGVSGSTWSMASLYNDPEWSCNMDRALSKLGGPGVELEQATAWLIERAKEEDFSLTDLWGVLTSAGIMKQMDLRRLSEEADRSASNPYPVYCAIEQSCLSEGPIEGKWFEVTPHEAGFPELGLFIHTSLLGSKFESGQLLEKKLEMDMIKLQGVFGSALAHGEMVQDFIPPWMKVLDHADPHSLKYIRVYRSLCELMVLIQTIIQDPVALSEVENLQEILREMVTRNDSESLELKGPEERGILFEQWSLQLVTTVQTWSQNLEDGAFKKQVSFLTKDILPLLLKWEWGTTNSFLYKYQDSPIPACLKSQQQLHLVDAGLLINVAYPSFLGTKRDMDLIITLEYSAGNMFETLTLAKEYAAAVKKPFPEIHADILEDRVWPKDCYVFEGQGDAPSIVYMPLFNQQNCRDAEEFKAKMEEFSTFQRPFNQQKINFLLETAKSNIQRNRDVLLREMKKAALSRQRKKGLLEVQLSDLSLNPS